MTEKKPKRPRAKPSAPARKRRPAVPKHKDRAELVGDVGPATIRVTFPKDEEVQQGSAAYKWTVPPKPSRFDLLATVFDNIDKPAVFCTGLGFGLGLAPLVVYLFTN